jgi:predicted metalloendopeptidase
VNRALPLAALVTLACVARPPVPPPPPPAAAAPVTFAPPPAQPGIDPSLVKRDVDPCTDFYQFACGGWLERTTLPADRSTWSRSFDVMEEENKAKLRAILDAAVANGPAPEDRHGQQVADLYAACMDEAAVEKGGLISLLKAWNRLGAITEGKSFSATVGRLHAAGSGALFGIDTVQDARDSTQVIGHLAQGGLSLPDREAYLKTDAASAAVRADLVEHIRAQLAATGLSPGKAAGDARSVLEIETRIARSHWSEVEARDPQRTTTRLALADLKKAAPSFDWDGYLAALGAPGLVAFTVTAPQALVELERLLRSTTAAGWRGYLRWHMLAEAAQARALPRRLSDAHFWFRASHFTGEKAMPARWKHCVELTDGLMGEALGQAFVRRHFGGDARARALALVGGIQQAMGRRIDGLGWMDEPTRRQAREKLAAVENKIAFPETWRSYDGLVVQRDDLAASVEAARAFELKRRLAKAGRPVDRTEWDMSAPTVNAYYEPSRNEMVFPAGILQPPFYTAGANDAVNAGAIGMVVAHELTHGYDDEGRQYDGKGNLADWWSKPVAAEFDRRAQCVARQYAAYPAIDEVNVDGQLTLGENIADLGGLKLAHTAYRASRAGRPEEAPVGGFGADQQFFLAHAQAWCSKVRPEAARLLAGTDPHSPARWRVNGPLSNLPEFAAAFQCGPGAPMVRAERCDLW